MADYKLLVGNSAGVPEAELDEADIETVSWALNEPAGMQFGIGAANQKLVDHLDLLTSHLQVWRAGQIIWWGRPIGVRGDTARLTFDCADRLWDLSRIHVGHPRANLLTNGSFQTDAPAGGGPAVTGWTVVNVDDHAIVTNNARLDSQALQLNNFDDLNGYAEQTVTTGLTQGAGYVAVAELYIAENLGGAPAWSGAAYAERGLYVSMFKTSDDSFLGEVVVPLDDALRDQWKNKWVRLETDLLQSPQDFAVYFKVRLYAPGAWVVWDAARFVENKFLAGTFKVDQTAIAEKLLDHAQDTAIDKPDLDIAKSITASGVIRERAYYYDEYPNILTSLQEFPQLEDGFDFSIELTATTCTFTTHYPTKGSAQPKLVLELGRNIASISYTEDGEQTANRIFALGEGNGPGRDEIEAIDDTTLGGLVLEEVWQADRGTPIGLLDEAAAQRLADRKNTVKIPSLTTYDGGADLIGVLEVGDTVPVRVDAGWIQVNADYRIVRMHLKPASETLELEVVPA
jgi:hypothetical protein